MNREEEYLKILESNKTLRDNIDKYKEAFVMYYGEDKRSLIEEKFSKVLLIGAISSDNIKMILGDIKKNKSNEIIDSIFLDNEGVFTKEDLFGNNTLENNSLCPINDYYKFIELYKLGSENRQKMFLDKGFDVVSSYIKSLTKDEYMEMINTGKILDKYQNIPDILKETLSYYCNVDNADDDYVRIFNQCKTIFDKIDPNISLDNISEYVNSSKFFELNRILDLYNKGLVEFKDYMSKFSKYEKIVEENDRIKYEARNKCKRDFIKENLDLVPDLGKEEALKYANGNDSFLSGDINHYLFDSFLGIGSFSTESENLLNDINESYWRKQSIMDDRIKYFRLMGIDLGDDYQSYLNNEEVKRIWPMASRIDKFIKDKEDNSKKADSLSFDNVSENKQIREEIEKLHLLDKADSFNSSIYSAGSVAFVNPNVVRGEYDYDLFSLLVVNVGNVPEGSIDHTICHELNHLFELQLQEVKDNKYSCISGWDSIYGDINQESKTDVVVDHDNKRSYELFNEIINELIAQDISKIMQENNNYVFDSKDNAKYRGTTSYEHSIFLIRDFYNEFKNEIIESRSNGNIEAIWNKVGKENFDELNSLFDIYFKNFAGMKIYALYSSLEKKEDNELTRVYFNLISKKEEIMTKMREYSLANEEVHGISR